MSTRVVSVLAVLVIAVQAVSPPLSGAATCTDRIAKLPPERVLTLHLKGGERLESTIVTPASGAGRLGLRGGRSIPLTDVMKVTWKEGKLSPGWILFGLAVGTGVGAAVGSLASANASSSGLDFSGAVIMAGWTAGGAFAGLLAGTIIPLIPHTHTIECREEVR